jgi:hypothetical protein
MVKPAHHDEDPEIARAQHNKSPVRSSRRPGRASSAGLPAEAPLPRQGRKPSGRPESASGTAGATRLERLAAEQGVTPVTDIEALRGDFWPEDEDSDEFLATIRAWRENRPYPTQS